MALPNSLNELYAGGWQDDRTEEMKENQSYMDAFMAWALGETDDAPFDVSDDDDV